MSIILWVLLGITFDVAILIFLKAMIGERPKMAYSEYKKKYWSLVDSHPEDYSNFNDYI